MIFIYLPSQNSIHLCTKGCLNMKINISKTERQEGFTLSLGQLKLVVFLSLDCGEVLRLGEKCKKLSFPISSSLKPDGYVNN